MVWKDIAGYEGIYMVSNRGEIMSVRTKIIKKQSISKNGYWKVVLCVKNVRVNKYVHRLVAEAFVDDFNDSVDHIDRNKLNNNFENLRCVNKRDNMRNTSIKKSSKFFGVRKYGEKWLAQIKNNGKNVHLGAFSEEETAHKIYEIAVSLLETTSNSQLRRVSTEQLNKDYGCDILIKSKTSSTVGIWYSEKKNKWNARKQIDGKRKSFGWFANEIDAINVLKIHS